MASICRAMPAAASRSRADRYYHFEPGRGVLAVSDGGSADREIMPDATCSRSRAAIRDARDAQKAARGIFGAAIAHCLEGRGLASRDVMLAMRRRGREGMTGRTSGSA